MALPKLVDHIKIKEWIPKLKKPHPCYLYDFDSMGITPEQFAEVIVGEEAMIFEKPFKDKLAGTKCPWCDYNARKKAQKGNLRTFDHQISMQNHIYTHVKNIVSYQVLKFQSELYTMRLQLVRQGHHECIAFLVQHECNYCIAPVIEGREGMCALPTSTRNRMRSLKTLGYPIKSITKHRIYEWSAMGVIILL